MNDYFINIVEKTTDKIPPSLPCSDTDQITDSTINEIIKRYEHHPSILNIQVNTSCTESNFQFKEATRNDVSSIIKTLKSSASIGFNGISLKLVIIASEIISDLLSELINETVINKSYFPAVEKVACVTPAFKKEDCSLKKNYRPISVLNVFSKIFERFLSDQMVPYLNSILSVFISAYRKNYSCQHVLLRMIEIWRRCLNKNKVVGVILMDF